MPAKELEQPTRALDFLEDFKPSKPRDPEQQPNATGRFAAVTPAQASKAGEDAAEFLLTHFGRE